MTLSVRDIVAAAQQLTPTEQREVIRALSRGLQQQQPPLDLQMVASSQQPLQSRGAADNQPASPPRWPVVIPTPAPIPTDIHRAKPITDLSLLVAHFWPDDETADDINSFIAEQRAFDRLSDMPDNPDDL